MDEPIEGLLDRARAAQPNDRTELYRHKTAKYGPEAIDAMGEWLADPELCRFAVRVIGKAADLGARDPAIAKLNEARADTTPAQRADIDQELRRLGVNPGTKKRAAPRRSRRPVTFYFTESATRLSNSQTKAQLDTARADVLARTPPIRGGDFAATCSVDACRCCAYPRLCPSVAR